MPRGVSFVNGRNARQAAGCRITLVCQRHPLPCTCSLVMAALYALLMPLQLHRLQKQVVEYMSALIKHSVPYHCAQATAHYLLREAESASGSVGAFHHCLGSSG